MRSLLIDNAVRQEIAAVIERAKAHVVQWDKAAAIAIGDHVDRLSLSEKAKIGADKLAATMPNRSQGMVIPRGYHVAFSFEQQPAGLMRHLSVSVERVGKVPNRHAVASILKEFGFSDKLVEFLNTSLPVEPYAGGPMRMWLEEFAPGHEAVNVLELVPQ
jgi:hypothetical protein